MSTAALTDTARRELARRSNGGLEITLYWHPHDNTTSIDVHETATEETISFAVPADRALDAFYHPFVHLAEKNAAPRDSASYPDFDEALIFGEGDVDQQA